MPHEIAPPLGTLNSKYYELYSADMLAVTQMLHAIANTLARTDPTARNYLLEELRARRETLQHLGDVGNASDDAQQAALPLSLLISDLEAGQQAAPQG